MTIKKQTWTKKTEKSICFNILLTVYQHWLFDSSFNVKFYYEITNFIMTIKRQAWTKKKQKNRYIDEHVNKY